MLQPSSYLRFFFSAMVVMAIEISIAKARAVM
jgi:hypothetical protein